MENEATGKPLNAFDIVNRGVIVGRRVEALTITDGWTELRLDDGRHVMIPDDGTGWVIVDPETH